MESVWTAGDSVVAVTSVAVEVREGGSEGGSFSVGECVSVLVCVSVSESVSHLGNMQTLIDKII